MAIDLKLGRGVFPPGNRVTGGLIALLAAALAFVGVMLLVSAILGRETARPARNSLDAATNQAAAGDITETGDRLLTGQQDNASPAGRPGGIPQGIPEADAEAERRLAEIRQRQEEERRRLEELEFQAQHAPLGQGLYGLAPATRNETEEEDSAPAEALSPTEGNSSRPALPGPHRQGPDDGEFRDELLQAGTVIPVATITAIDSGLPGIVRAQVTAPVRDSATGTRVLVPPGAMLVGTWADNADVHAERLHVYWRKLQMPNGESFEMDDTPSADLAGIAGVSGERRTRFWRTLGSAFAVSLVTNLATREKADDNPVENALRRAAGSTAQTVTERLLERGLDAAPVFRIAAGTRLNVVLEQDLRLPPWATR